MRTASLDDFDADGRTPVFEDPYTVHLGLEAGDNIPPHTHPGQAILFAVLEGELDLSVGDETEGLSAGEFASFDGNTDIAVEAIEDVRTLVVFADQ